MTYPTYAQLQETIASLHVELSSAYPNIYAFQRSSQHIHMYIRCAYT